MLQPFLIIGLACLFIGCIAHAYDQCAWARIDACLDSAKNGVKSRFDDEFHLDLTRSSTLGMLKVHMFAMGFGFPLCGAMVTPW